MLESQTDTFNLTATASIHSAEPPSGTQLVATDKYHPVHLVDIKLCTAFHAACMTCTFHSPNLTMNPSEMNELGDKLQ